MSNKPLSFDDVTDCFAVPGSDHIIDAVHPLTGLSLYGGRTAADIAATYPGAVRMKLADWMKDKAERQHAPITWAATTEAKYHEMLEVLPPAMWAGGAFLVGEPDDHDAETGEPRFQGYYHEHGAYFVASRPMTRTELRAFLTQKGIAR